ncbi:nicotinamidase [Aureimonas endophytica]|uniref:Nicotinamidase n=1 Tax=Aureimonas endophytica TaxID=2027858 RepID=A0A917DZ40_9HYPH|nr:bifunctional nicotinamidase/pyrazinamidase [Aureimonas endophytica]GGD86282.1 nicotinamidase [Aureimonas endophytica]
MGFEIAATDALIVVDMQNDFCPGGALAVPGGDALISPINAMMARFPIVVATQDWHPASHASFASAHGRAPFDTIELAYGTQVLWPDHCVQRTQGAEFHPALDTDRFQMVVRKGFHPGVDSYSGFVEADRSTVTGLSSYLRERGAKRLYLVGLALDFCVAWTAFDARAAGFEVVVVENACRAIDLGGSLDVAFAEFERLGISRRDWP